MDRAIFSSKTNRMLLFILVVLLLIGFRAWHLAFVQHETKLEEAKKPRFRSVRLPADRGEIVDRFGVLLATNTLQYRAAIDYGEIAQIPWIGWKILPSQKREKTYPRKEHIRGLSWAISKIIQIDPERIEDLINSKASLFPHVPFVLKERLSEEAYAKLKILQKDWPGLLAERVGERVYPQGKLASHLLGYLGSMSEKKFQSIAQETKQLEEALLSFESAGALPTLPAGYTSFEQVYQRLYELKERAYGINARVGKAGVEAQFEEELRGFWGIGRFEVDQKGKIVREVPGGKKPIAGKKIALSISAELQAFAENLLIANEKEREGKSRNVDPADGKRKVQKQPWIKGGAIIAFEPTTGEVLTFASHPRFDPNDFLDKQNIEKISEAIETQSHIGRLWDGHLPLSRERPKGKIEEQRVDWPFFISQIISKDGPLYSILHQHGSTLKEAIAIQEDWACLTYFHPELSPTEAIANLKDPSFFLEDPLAKRRLQTLFAPLSSPKDALFFLDLLRLAAPAPRFSDELLGLSKGVSIETYRNLSQAFFRLEGLVKKRSEERFRKEIFPQWKKEHQQAFLQGKRAEEKAKKSYAKPYLDYLDQKEKELFSLHWEESRWEALCTALLEGETSDSLLLQKELSGFPKPLQIELFQTFRPFSSLKDPLLSNPRKTEQDLAASFYSPEGYGLTRSFAYQTSATFGSIFKLIPSYEELRQGKKLSIIDEFHPAPTSKKTVVAYTANHTPYPRIYKGGRLPKSSALGIGKIDLIGALAHSSNPYFSILAGDLLAHPEDLNHAARLFGLGQKSGIQLPGESAGNLPSDLESNRTGLYSYAIGQHTLLASPIQAATMLAALANGGILLQPQIIQSIQGEKASPSHFSEDNCFAQKELQTVGIDFPLFSGAKPRSLIPETHTPSPTLKRRLHLPPSIRHPLLEGLDQSIWSSTGNARANRISALGSNPALMKQFCSLEHQMIGKTSTAEFLWNPYANPSSQAQMYKHVWFGAISFDSPKEAPKALRWSHPDLVVVVFLRYGASGKDAAPLAAQMIHKWRSIRDEKKLLAPRTPAKG